MKPLSEIKERISSLQKQMENMNEELERLNEQIKTASLEKRYVLDHETLTVKEAYIEPTEEWCYMSVGAGARTKIFNDMNPKTLNRTGAFYPEDEIFSLVEDGKEELKNFIKNRIKCNQEHIDRIDDKNKRLTNALMSL